MKLAVKLFATAAGTLLSLLAGCIAVDVLAYHHATPPKNVTDVGSCLAWLKKPMGAYKITDGNTVYYRVLGPAGRSLASGPAAYTFDAQGRLIGWTADVGDFPTPGLSVSPNARKEKITLVELRSVSP